MSPWRERFGLGRTCARPTARAARTPESPYRPFKMGLQSYSLRGLTETASPTCAKALAATKELGLHYWESFPCPRADE